jgi:multisubunit Na+/H+ antiporter MnhB subunit
MIEMGLVVAFGLVMTFFKMRWETRLKMLGRPLLWDVLIFVGLNALHWGTFSGLMVAAVGAAAASLTFSALRFTVGWMEGSLYYPGRLMNVADRVIAERKAK